MFTWAIIDYNNKIKDIQRATLDVPASRPGEHWVIIQKGKKLSKNLVYNPATREAENG